MKRALRRPHCYAAPLCLMLAAGSVSAQEFTRYGPNPTLPEPSRGLLPSMSERARTRRVGRHSP